MTGKIGMKKSDNEKDNKKNNKNNVRNVSAIRICVVLAALLGIAVSLWNILPPYLERAKADRDYQKLADAYVKVSKEEPGESDGEDSFGDGESDEQEKKKDWWSQDVKINFEELKQQNPDIIAWIRFDNPDEMDINYPVLYSGDNETYLRKDIYGETHTAGCIFLEGLNQPDFSDRYNILYGHNMRDGSMFGSLKKYKEQEFYENNPYFTLYTKDMACRYQIFSVHAAKNGGEVYKIGYQADEEYQEFINDLVSASVIDTGLHPEKEDKILTLSTCTGDGYTNRFTVHAVCVDEQTTALE